jgi:hypothetical protein
MSNPNWTIAALEVHPQAEQQTNVVFAIHWRAELSQDDQTASNYGSVGVTYVAGEPFTPFTELTQNQVVGWVKEALGADKVSEIEANLALQLQSLLNPVSISPALPWN